jgi:hypothetical protein
MAPRRRGGRKCSTTKRTEPGASTTEVAAAGGDAGTTATNLRKRKRVPRKPQAQPYSMEGAEVGDQRAATSPHQSGDEKDGMDPNCCGRLVS